jgi:hypothetical protein
MSLAAFQAETASGEGAHGPDRSRLAKCYHCRTNRQKRQSAAERDLRWSGLAGCGWLAGHDHSSRPVEVDLLRVVLSRLADGGSVGEMTQ